MDQDHVISKYDRLYGNLRDLSIYTKESTFSNVDLTGRAETFIVQTFRHENGDYIFVQCIDENKMVTRVALPPKVANVIAAQRDSLTAKRRSLASTRNMKKRMEEGYQPTPPSKRAKKKQAKGESHAGKD